MNLNKQLHISTIALWTGIALILATGLLHLVEAPENLQEMAYKGILFYLNAAAAVVAAVGIFRQRNWGWWLGVLVAGGSLVMYAISRTIGLPGLPAADESWLEPSGVLSLLVETGFVITAGTVLFHSAHPKNIQPAHS